MSNVRFIGENLIDEDTKKPLLITKEEIIEKTLSLITSTDRMVDGVFLAVKELTGKTVVRNRYRESSLYNEIEEQLNSTEVFIERRQKFQECVKKALEDREYNRVPQYYQTIGKINERKRIKKKQLERRSRR